MSSDRNKTRRSVLKSLSGTAAIAGVGVSTAKGSDSSTTLPPECPDSATKEECEKLKERQKKAKEEMEESMSSANMVQSDNLSIQSSLPTVGPDNDSYGTQNGSSSNGDKKSHLPYTYVDHKENTSGLTNKAQARAIINFANVDYIWAWSSTGTQFKAGGSGRVRLFAKGLYTGEVVAGGSASSSATYEIELYDLQANETVKSDIIWSPSSTVVPWPQEKNDKSFRKSMEADVIEGHTYLLRAKVKTTAAVATTGTARADAYSTDDWRDWSIDGYLQWTNMSANWMG